MEKLDNWVTDSLSTFTKNLHILVVDHDLVSLQRLVSLLQHHSYHITTAQLASVALSLIRERGNCFHLVMTNESMPDMDCLTFMHALLENNTAVVLMSSGMHSNFATRALTEGRACYFLRKPISKDDLNHIWQYVYQKNRNTFKQTQKTDCIEKAILGKVSQGIEIVESVGLSRLAAADTYSNGIKCQQMINNEMDKNKHMESYVNLVDSNFRGKRSINDIEGINEEKMVKYSSETDNFGSTIDENHEKRKEYYMSSVGRTRVVWTAERRRKFTDAINKLGDKIRPKLILKMMNEPCLTLRQVANHLQKYKAQVECNKKKCENKPPSRQTSRPTVLVRSQFQPLLQKPHHETSKFGKESFSSVLRSDRYRLIAPRMQPNPRQPVSHFVNHGLRMLNHNFQRVGFNYNSISLNVNKEVGLSADTIQKFQNEGSILQTLSGEKFGLEKAGVKVSELNFPNDSNIIQEAASSTIFNDIEFSDNLHDVIQMLDLPDFELEDQEAMLRETTLLDSTIKLVANSANGSNQMSDITKRELPSTSANKVSQRLAEYADFLNILDDDSYSYGSNLDVGDVERYCEWLRNNVLENGNS